MNLSPLLINKIMELSQNKLYLMITHKQFHLSSTILINYDRCEICNIMYNMNDVICAVKSYDTTACFGSYVCPECNYSPNSDICASCIYNGYLPK